MDLDESRRRFLKNSGLCLGGLARTGIAAACNQIPPTTVPKATTSSRLPIGYQKFAATRHQKAVAAMDFNPSAMRC